MATIKAVIFDWAGTMVDFGSFAPMGVFVDTFKEFGIEATIAQARAPMGMPKWDHIDAMLKMPPIAEAWQAKFGHAPTAKDVDQIYEVFVPMTEKTVAKYADLVPGAVEMLAYLERNNIQVGSTTGYTRSIMQHVLPIAREQGYVPENLVCSDDLKEGRPGPLGMYKSFVDLGVYPPEAVIKIDDTVPGIQEGVAAGCINVGVTLSGNYAGLTVDEMSALSETDKDDIRDTAGAKLTQAGADYIIDSVADLPALIDTLKS